MRPASCPPFFTGIFETVARVFINFALFEENEVDDNDCAYPPIIKRRRYKICKRAKRSHPQEQNKDAFEEFYIIRFFDHRYISIG